MKRTTLDLPDDLMRSIKLRAARENRKLKDLIAELLRRGLAAEAPSSVRYRVELPLVDCVHEARSGEELTPERVAELLDQQDAGDHRE